MLLIVGKGKREKKRRDEGRRKKEEGVKNGYEER